MAICEKCGKKYLSKECLRCKNENNNLNKINNQKINNKLLLIPTIILIITGILSYQIFFTNPLIGTWQSNQKKLFTINLGKIKFTKDKMIMMGIISKVKYEIDGKNIYVTDQTGTGMLFKIIDNNTISSELMGMKTIYKKIE